MFAVRAEAEGPVELSKPKCKVREGNVIRESDKK